MYYLCNTKRRFLGTAGRWWKGGRSPAGIAEGFAEGFAEGIAEGFEAEKRNFAVMKVAVFQMDVMQGAVEWNLDKASLWIEGVKAEVAVLPELAGEYVEGLRKVCMKCGRAVCFWDEEGFCFIRPDGAIERGAVSFEGMTFESERIGVVNCGGYGISAAAVGMGVCSVVDLRGRVVAKADPDLECAFVANLDKEFRTFGS